MASREYPSRPIVAVGGVVFIDDRVVLVKRRNEPLVGRWSLPGGAVEVGERLQEALRRELREELGIEVAVGPLIELLDRITRDEKGRIRYHYVLADYVCGRVRGTLRPGSDAGTLALVDPDELAPYELTERAVAVIAQASLLR